MVRSNHAFNAFSPATANITTRDLFTHLAQPNVSMWLSSAAPNASARRWRRSRLMVSYRSNGSKAWSSHEKFFRYRSGRTRKQSGDGAILKCIAQFNPLAVPTSLPITACEWKVLSGTMDCMAERKHRATHAAFTARRSRRFLFSRSMRRFMHIAEQLRFGRLQLTWILFIKARQDACQFLCCPRYCWRGALGRQACPP